MKIWAMRLKTHPKRFLITGTLTVLALCVSALPARGQLQIIPDRGFHTSGAYALNDIEIVNATSGNLMLDVPLVALPTGRGGNPGFQLRLRYNSKIWDGDADMAQSPTNPTQQIAVTWLVQSSAGGWRYNLRRYSWSLDNRNNHGVVYPTSDLRRYNIWKMSVTFPDGSSREFRPNGYDDEVNDGYFRVQPAPGMTYYSTDGTYARLAFGATTNDWTLYFPDGSRVLRQGSLQRTYDRNGNYTEIYDVANYNGTGHAATVVADQLGRSITVEFGTNEDYIYMQGMGQLLTTTVKWANTYVTKQYRAGNHFQYTVNLTNKPIKIVSEIALPSQLGGNLKYTFGYNGWPVTGMGTSVGWGELSSLVLPSGATAAYRYKRDNVSGSGIPTTWILDNSPIEKKLDYSLEYDGVSSPAPTETWTYDLNSTMGRITDPDQGVSTDWFASTAAAGWDSGLVYKSERADGSVIERIWQENRPYLPPGETIYFTVGVNTCIKTEFTSIRNSSGVLSKTAIVDYQYDKNGNVTRKAEYDWVAYTDVPRDGLGKPTAIPGTAVLKRVVTNTYNAATPDSSDSFTLSPNVYNRPTAPQLLKSVGATEISDGVTTAARTEFTYDNPTTTGNLTQQKSWDSTKGGYSNPLQAGNSTSVSTQYNAYGSPILTTDARGFQTQFVYGPVGGFSDLYVTQTKKAYGSSVQLTRTTEYDFNTGLVTRLTDVDNNVSTATTYDAIGRPTLLKTAEGKPEETRTRIEYADTLRRIITRSDLNTVGDEKLVSIKHFDQLGRIRLSRQLEDATSQDATNEQTGIKVQTRYFLNGASSHVLKSNPYRAATSGGAGSESTMGWTRTIRDSGGRVIEVQTFGGAACPAPCGSNTNSTGTISTTYDANFMTVSDEAQRLRRSMIDALGRLVRVDEPDKTSGLLNDGSGNPVQPTYYVYDALSNPRRVEQGTQTRYFLYDSLSRLIRTRNPEQNVNSPSLDLTDPLGPSDNKWSNAFRYDSNDNLIVQTDARGVSVHYSYDGLNRVTRTWFNASSDPVSTSNNVPALPSDVGASNEVNYAYDLGANGKGRLVSTSNGLYRTELENRDALGRPRLVRQSFLSLGQAYEIGYQYNLAGTVTRLTYPSNRYLDYAYDGAGRANDVRGILGDGQLRTYATTIQYSPLGGIVRERFDTSPTPLYRKAGYNSSGQLEKIRLSSVDNDDDNNPDSWNRGRLFNFYGGADNNGTLRRQEIYVPGGNFYQDNFTYDALNRLTAISEKLNGTGNDIFKQAYNYDRWGNRTINATDTFNVPEPQFDTSRLASNNQLYGLGENFGLPCPNLARNMCYDAAGNLTRDIQIPNSGFLVYDAENRMTRPNPNVTYNYDGDGRRVHRTTASGSTLFIYGLNDELLLEVDPAGNKEYGYRNGKLLVTATVASAPQSVVRWMVADQLGTARMVVDKTGSLAGITRHDYLPFGEEISGSIGGRSSQGYPSAPNQQTDGVRQQFTSKERDLETGLDYFGARYFSSTQGRFISVDPENAGAELVDPQSWNGYSYAGNSPLTFFDPTGLWKEVPCNSGKRMCWEAEKGDSIGSLAQLLGVNFDKLNRHFQRPNVETGQVYDVSGFYRNNNTVIYRNIVEVYLVTEPPKPESQVYMIGAMRAVKQVDPEPRSKILIEAIALATIYALDYQMKQEWSSYVPPPVNLPAFPDAVRVRPKNNRTRWKDSDGNIYEWDYQHGRVEKYDKRGRHLGEFDPNTGEQTKPADPSRRTEP